MARYVAGVTRTLLALTLLTGCGRKGLIGTPVEEPMPAPEFTVTAHTGETRTRDDLLGKPTAMWFYPAAATFG